MIGKKLKFCILVIAIIGFKLNLNSQTTITVGNPSTTSISEKYPFNDYYNYSWSNVIYLQSEIGQGGQITQIAFNVYNNSTVSMANQKIYARHTTATGYSNNTYPGTSGYTLVYDGTIAYSGAGWKTITLTTPFIYNGTDNLEFLYENRSGAWSNNFPYFYVTSGYSTNRVKRDFSDASFPSTCVNCGAFANIPNTRLIISCATPLSITPSAPSICNGLNVNLVGSGASTYTWAPSAGLNTTTGATVTASPTVTTTYTLTGVDGSSCSQTKTVTVTVNPLPTVSISPSSVSICSGSNTSLTASGASTYSWAPSTGLSATTGASVTANPTVTTTYTVTGTNANGCVNTSTVQVTVNSLPNVSVSPTSATVCNGNSTNLVASGATAYTWSPSAGLNTTSGANVIATPTVSTTYTVTGTTNGCSSTVSATVSIGEVNSGMAISTGGADICSNSSLSLSLESKKASLASANGTLTSEKYPFNGYYNFGWSDVIYTQSELGSAGTITDLAFYVDNIPSNFTMDNQSIYVKSTSATGFSNSDYPGTTGFTLVYSGSITYNGSGWKTINLNTTFSYDGSSNLEVLFVNNDGSYGLSGFPLFRYASGYATNRVKRDYADGSFPSACVNCGTFANVPNTKIIIDRPLGTFVKWQSSTDNVNYSDVQGGTTQNYSTSVNTSTYFRAQVTSATCGTSYSDASYYVTNNNYYVNDNSLTGDIYNTVVGNPTNDGRSPSRPKASISSIVTTYVLGPCDTIFVDNGNYTEGVTMFSSDGGNAQHYTVIHGAGIDKTVFTAAASTNNFYFNQTSYVKVEGFTLNSSQSNLSNVFFNGATNNIIDNNKINHTVSANIDVYGTTIHSNKNQITNNKIFNSSTLGYGILIRTNSDSTIVSGDSITMSVAGSKSAILAITDKVGNDIYYPHAATITGNTISAYTYGVALYGVDYPISSFTISNNKITLQSSTTADGASVWLTNVSASSAVRTTINNNKFIGGKHGIYMGVTANYSKIYNNYFSNNNYGLYIASSTSNSGELYFNSFYNSITNTFFTTTGASNWTLKNNIFYTTSSVSTDANISAGSTSAFDACNYNLYYAPNGAGIANFGGTAYTTLSAWQGVAHSTETPNGDQNSISGNPGYSNLGANLLEISATSNATYHGLVISGITNDIYNANRNTPPSIGANEPMPLANAGNDVSICFGDSIQLQGGGGSVYSWSPATGLSSTSIANPIASPTVTTTYTLTVTEGSNSTTDMIVVTVHSLPQVTANANDTTSCSGSPITLTGGGATAYNWTGNVTNGVAFVPSETTSYTVTGTDTHNCTNKDSISIYVSSYPLVNAGVDIVVCPSGSAVLSVATDSSYSYSWQPTTGLSCTQCMNPICTPISNTSTYTVLVTDFYGCESSDTVLVTKLDKDNHLIDFTDLATLFASGTLNYEFSYLSYTTSGEAQDSVYFCISPLTQLGITVNLKLTNTLSLNSIVFQYEIQQDGNVTGLRLKENENIISVDPTFYNFENGTLKIAPIYLESFLLTKYYAKLKKELDGGYWNVPTDKKLNFLYEEEYNAGELDYKIFDSKRQVLGIENVLTKSIGLNNMSIQLASNLPSGFYYLEVKSSKGEKYYLRFKI